KSRQCENGWKSFGWKCYYFSTTKLTWTQSRDECVGKGGHLVIITSRAEQDFLSSQVRETQWIGLNDLETEGEWMWVNNLSLKDTESFFYLRYWFSAPEGPNEPDNWKIQDPSGENCGSLGGETGATNNWFDASCLTLKKFICEK
ncbi:immune-related, lectin-like receptor 1, partial [Silurus asotus]